LEFTDSSHIAAAHGRSTEFDFKHGIVGYNKLCSATNPHWCKIQNFQTSYNNCVKFIILLDRENFG